MDRTCWQKSINDVYVNHWLWTYFVSCFEKFLIDTFNLDVDGQTETGKVQYGQWPCWPFLPCRGSVQQPGSTLGGKLGDQFEIKYVRQCR